MRRTTGSHRDRDEELVGRAGKPGAERGGKGKCRDEAVACELGTGVVQEIRRWQGESLHCRWVRKESSAIKVMRRCTGQGRVLESQDWWRTGARRGIR